MKTLVSASAHFAITPDGHLWTPNASLRHQFWTRYLSSYDEVRLLVQTKKYDEPPVGWNRATGEGVVAAPIPDFLTPRLYTRNIGEVKRVVRQTLAETEAVHLRVSCFVGNIVWRGLQAGRPYGVEVVADPYDSFAPDAYHHPLQPVLRKWIPWELRRQCAGATAATYVTKDALQRRYPAGPGALSTYFSDVDLSGNAFVPAPRSAAEKSTFKLVFVGTMAQLYKAPDVLVEAVARCVQRGVDLHLTIIGKGQYQAQLETRAAQLGITERIIFRGQLSDRHEVQKELDMADLFVLPSHQEGLPRAMVEAMARALPCIGSTVGGIPELLPSEDLVPPGNIEALAEKIKAVLGDPARMAQMSKRNLETAHEYEEAVLRERRDAFYKYVHDKTADWLKQNLLKNQS